MEKTLFELSKEGRRAYSLPGEDTGPFQSIQVIPQEFLRESENGLPSLSELEVVRHYTHLSRLNFSIDSNFYPLGSCSMKYNPKMNEVAASLSGFAKVHPLQPAHLSQGILSLLYELEKLLSEISGMDRFCLQSCAGAQGEFLGMLIVRAYFDSLGQKRTQVIVPDSAHGTNPSSAHLAGFTVVSVPSDAKGHIDSEALEKVLNPDVACLMLTNPNTLGLFERDILRVAKDMHKIGALLYYDGANLNPLLGLARPGDMGFDMVHLNLHKTFSTPHGGGGPGAGPVGVKAHLAKFLPTPVIEKKEGEYFLNENLPDSVGRVRSFYGNVGILVRAYTYIKALGKEGLEKTGQAAVLNANYLFSKLKKIFETPFPGPFMHEFVVSAKPYVKHGVRALDIAKRLLDFGMHPPTVYFPLIVEEAMMIEPTETETRETLDAYADLMVQIAREAQNAPEKLHQAPTETPVRRLDEVAAAKELRLVW
ncbi:MAG: aminomethyl-transferring glycine dehydrogenase subunit GcvPB [Chlamydiae bacterium]|nr:aminomethyl-transferring glycine dehydrogenase subunit GcvPB [Chlamydiota bacterium]MBI3267021.1 aminomethyl-transferring glycine dehydrogenase subunit GcvPB [Chlamydiota bacterium]